MSLVYFDTGVLLKLVIEEPLSPAVRRFVATRKIPVFLTLLHESEMENALCALLFRKTITSQQLAGSRNLLNKLRMEGKFRRRDVSLDQAARELLKFAPTVTVETGCRTLDLLHICSALIMGADTLVSTDQRQCDAAKYCGLRVFTPR